MVTRFHLLISLIVSSVMLVNKVIDQVRRRKGKCTIIKVSFKKAYDSVN